MLEIHGLTKSFGKLHAIRGISLSVEGGRISGLIGPNGSGKTTLFNLISGFLKPNDGSILLEGESIRGVRPSKIASRGLIRTFQLTSIYRDMTALENVLMGHHLVRPGGSRNKRPALFGDTESPLENSAAILDFMGLGGVAHVPARLLPGGTQRMLSIATALAPRPSVLLLDEPLAGLHAAEKASVIARLSDLRSRGLTMLLVEHDMKSVMSVCDHLYVINFGEKIAEGEPSVVANNPTVIEAYLGSPGTAHA